MVTVRSLLNFRDLCNFSFERKFFFFSNDLIYCKYRKPRTQTEKSCLKTIFLHISDISKHDKQKKSCKFNTSACLAKSGDCKGFAISDYIIDAIYFMVGDIYILLLSFYFAWS